jgi:hypothetical protein
MVYHDRARFVSAFDDRGARGLRGRIRAVFHVHACGGVRAGIREPEGGNIQPRANASAGARGVVSEGRTSDEAADHP